MKLLLGLVIFLQSVPLPAQTNMLNITILLRSIAEIETGNDDYAIGDAGERSRYQIREDVWKQYSKHDFKHYASKHLLAMHVARQHITNTLIRISATKPGVKLDAKDFYVIWNAGFYYYMKKDFKFERVLDYKIKGRAKRFQNLYDNFLQQESKNLELPL